ncbi:polymorphic toxin-type HINT domain-containing protein [Kitasatospora mediocidica]|uniref:polymorphic toxin-type HINT domain-containing protein n=1 Tax=Kitasatospora mediocidica TaxID=58352 RepID=UPI00068C6C06|nr:polymorphic toxin-type HINT domain-containing protein [Kitasatospora mediocidica]
MSLSLVFAVLLALLTAPTASALNAGSSGKSWSPTGTPLNAPTKSVSVSPVKITPLKPAAAPTSTPTPAAPPLHTGSATVQLGVDSTEARAARAATGGGSPASGGSTLVQAGQLPVSVGTDTTGAARTVQVTVSDPAKGKAVGIPTPLVTLTDADKGATDGKVNVALDLKPLGGQLWADRARLVAVPACALTTPDATDCRVQTPVTSTVDPASGTLTAEVSLSPAASGSTSEAPKILLGAIATAAGSGGNYAATSLNPSMAWNSGSNVGNFTYSYPVQLPPSVSGVAPSVALSYDSSAVDGMTSSQNAQSSWVGTGWDYQPGFIERSYQSCSKDGIPGSGDNCWAGQNATMSLAGHSGPLVQDQNDKTLWHPQNDDGTTVRQLTGAPNLLPTGEYWLVTTDDGTKYYFGQNRLPGGDGTDAPSNSAWSEPVYSPNKADGPCYNDATGAGSSCTMGWRWNLDYVVDVHQNLISYTYNPETNNYQQGGGQNKGGGKPASYIRGGTLSQIFYGQRLPDQIAAKGKLSPASVVTFGTGERCEPNATVTCAPNESELTTADAAAWHDIPVDQVCTGASCTNTSPTFFSTKRLTSISTKVLVGSSYSAVDSWALAQSWADPGDGTPKSLWLDSIIRTGYTSGNPTPLPPVMFGGGEMANRVTTTVAKPDAVPPQTLGLPLFNQPRMKTITTETGGQINIIYNDTDQSGTNPKPCSFTSSSAPSPAANTQPCMPVKWYFPGGSTTTPVSDWFQKYLVTDVTEQDAVTGIIKSTHYTYGGCGGAAWHQNDSPFTDPVTRTWDNFRGYQTVTTTTGSTNAGETPRTQQTVTYLRGMDGDAWATNSQCTGQVANPLGGPNVTDSDWLAGSVLATQVYDQANGTVQSMTGTTSSTDQKPTATQTPAPTNGAPALIARTPATQLTSKVMARLADGTTWRTTTKVDTIDQAYGARLTWSDDKGDGTSAAPEICTHIKYATGPTDPTVPTSAVLSAVSEKQAVAGACGTTATAANTVSDTRTLYDGKPFGQLGALGDPSSSQALDHYDTSGSPVYVLSGSLAPTDVYGRTLSVSTTDGSTYDTAGNQLTGPNTAVATTTTAYTPATGAVPTSITTTNPLGWTSTVTLDPGRSLPLTSSDPNKRVTTEHYDGLGRLVDVWQPGRSTDQTSNVEYSYAIDGVKAPSVVTTRTQRETNGNNTEISDFSWKTELYDGLGRLVQTQTTVPQTGNGRLISDTVYDSHGWAVLTRSPYFDINTLPNGTLVKPIDSIDSQVPGETKTIYDGMGRVTQSEFLSYNVPQWGTNTAYPGADRTDVTPPQGGTPTSTVTDSRGHTTALWQYHTPTATGNATDADVTSYSYTPSGQPASRADAAGNTWSYTYDLLGRQTSSSDPDTGVTKTVYDADARVDHTTDAKGNTLAYSYDLLGRKTGLYNGTVAPANQQAGWTYDTLALGQLTSSTRYGKGGTSGPAYVEATTGYDTAYHPLGTSITIPSTEGKLAGTYTTTNTYDPVLGTLASSTMPALPFLPAGTPAEKVGYDRTLTGYLIDSGGNNKLVQAVNYDAYGRPVKTTVGAPGNAVTSTQQYDQASGRVISSYVGPQNATSAADQYTYTYDPSGNVTSVSDNQSTAATDTQCFTYDYLGRLSSAWTDTGGTQTRPTGTWNDSSGGAPIGSGTSISVPGIGGCNNAGGPAGPASVGGPSPYWQSYTYDATGNRTGLTSHQVSSAKGPLDPSQVTGLAIASDGANQTFGVGVAGGTVWASQQNPDGSWVPFTSVTATSGQLSGVTSVAATWYNGQLTVVALANGKPWQATRNADGTWSGWTDLTVAVGALAQAATQVAIVATSSGLEIMALSGGRLLHTVRRADGTWEVWGDVYGAAGALTSPSQVAVAATPSGMEVIVTAGGTLNHTVRHSDGTWQAWGNVYGETGALPHGLPGGGQLGLTGTSTGLQVIALSGGTPWHTIRHNDGTWQSWGDVTGAAGAISSQTTIAATSTGANLKILTAGAGNVSYTMRNGVSLGWNAWATLSQQVITDHPTTTTQTFGAAKTVNTSTQAPNTGGGTGGPHALLSTTTTGASTGASSYQYDQLGNTTSVTGTSGTTSMVWNNEDQLASVSTTGHNGSTSYLYDADGNQLIRYEPSSTTVNLGTDELTLSTSDNSLSDVRYYGSSGGITITRTFTAQNPGGTTVYQAADPHGTNSVQIGTDPAQTVTRRLTDPFGNPRGNPLDSGVWAGDKGFVGGTLDPVTGLTNLGAREYDPVHGRFLNPDPLLDTSDPQQWNGYAYSNNDPVNSSDPTGRMHQADYYSGGAGETACTDPTGCSLDNTPEPTIQAPTGLGKPASSPGNGSGKGGNGKPKKKSFWKDPVGWSWDHKADIAEAVTYAGVFAGCYAVAGLGAAETAGATLVAGVAGCGAVAGAASTAAHNLLSSGGQQESILDGAASGEYSAIVGEGVGIAAKPVLGKLADFLNPCSNSFPAGTLVLLANGATKAIDKLTTGDQVASTDPQTSLTLAEPVTQTIVTPDDHAFTALTLTTTSQTAAALTSTQHHPYWNVTTHRWTDAADLHVGDQLLTTDGSTVTVRSVRNYETPEQTAYNLTVADLHTYYVLAGTTPILVHNSCGPDMGAAARAAAKNAPQDATMTAVARIKDTNITEIGYSGPSSRPAFLEPEIEDAAADGGQMFGGDAANCAEMRACNALFANHAADFEETFGRPLQLSDIEFLTVRSFNGAPEAACLSCQSALVRRGATDLSRG